MASLERFYLLGAALLIGIAPAIAGPLEDGRAAYDRKDYGAALKLWQPLADQGKADAQALLAVMYYRGQGVPQDYAEAAKWYRKAADQGNADAQLDLAFVYALGRGVPQDYVQALYWFNLSARHGNGKAAAYRESLASKMTAAQIAEAHILAREWVPK